MAAEGASATTSPVESKRLEGKVVVITGGASGIGEATARLFARHGANVIIADIDDDLGSAVCADITTASGGGSAVYAHCDVTVESDIAAAVDLAVSTFGRLDVMYNNAGVIDAPVPLVEKERSEFDRVMAVVATGAFLGTKHAARVMIPRRSGGCVVTTASVAGVLAGSGAYAYTCAKHAVIGLTKAAAVELGAYGIRVNCVSPYAVATRLAAGFVGGGVSGEVFERDMARRGVLKGAVLKAEDVARAVMYLASDEARYVNGHNLIVDGGFTIVNPSLLDYRPGADAGDDDAGQRTTRGGRPTFHPSNPE